MALMFRLTLLSLLGLAAGKIESSCFWDSGKGASFDLSRLTDAGNRPDGSYQIKDNSEETNDFMYVFNICKNVETVPRTWNETGQKYTGDGCERTGSYGQYLEGPAAAFQYAHNEKDGFCYHLNNDFSNGNFTLFDETDPSAGLVLTYTGGNMCHGNNPRQLRLTLLCRDDETRAWNIPDEEPVREPHNTPCLYEFRLKTGYGCPLECPVVDKRPCGGNGVCGFDPVVKKARCFCNVGMMGEDCNSGIPEVSTPMAGSAIMLVAVSVMLVIVLLFLGYMWQKMSRLNIDPDAYAQLSHKFNELGQITNNPMPGDGFAIAEGDIDFQADGL